MKVHHGVEGFGPCGQHDSEPGLTRQCKKLSSRAYNRRRKRSREAAVHVLGSVLNRVDVLIDVLEAEN
jgi:hypothetical protein